MAFAGLCILAAAGWYGYGWMTGVTPTMADLAYGQESDRQVLDLYLPEGATGPVPVVVWVHGGAFRMGDKEDPQSLEALRAAGFAVASVNYRLTGTDIWPAQLEDVTAAVAHLRANADDLGIDPARVALFGSSAGGFLVATTGLALAADPATGVQAVVDWFGPVDFTTMDADMEASAVARSTGRNDAADSPESVLIGMTVADNPAAAQAVSPLHYLSLLGADAELPPFLIMHGDADGFVAPGQSLRLRDALLAHPAAPAVTFELLPGAGHGSGAFQDAGATATVVQFLTAALD
ncbi:MAG: alpha/beta hydrolase [Rubellimicrobium sp.]|nr:alpha/beta hydrolase [Rubellimicrobium sp.]